MKIKYNDVSKTITEEITKTLNSIDDNQVEELVNAILKADKVFLA